MDSDKLTMDSDKRTMDSDKLTMDSDKRTMDSDKLTMDLDKLERKGELSELRGVYLRVDGRIRILVTALDSSGRRHAKEKLLCVGTSMEEAAAQREALRIDLKRQVAFPPKKGELRAQKSARDRHPVSHLGSARRPILFTSLLGFVVRNVRWASGMTQGDCSRAMEITQSAWGKVEKGITMADVLKVHNLCLLAGTTSADLWEKVMHIDARVKAESDVEIVMRKPSREIMDQYMTGDELCGFLTLLLCTPPASDE
jgi:hypothetical protein